MTSMAAGANDTMLYSYTIDGQQITILSLLQSPLSSLRGYLDLQTGIFRS